MSKKKKLIKRINKIRSKVYFELNTMYPNIVLKGKIFSDILLSLISLYNSNVDGAKSEISFLDFFKYCSFIEQNNKIVIHDYPLVYFTIETNDDDGHKVSTMVYTRLKKQIVIKEETTPF